MKKKVLTICLIVALAATAIIGGTLAYFTDIDKADNTFVTGNVKIELQENFGDNDPKTPEKLLPATGSAQAGTLKNGITKEVTVKNIGTEDAYVRVHIAIPSVLDNGNPEFDAGKNTLHFNYTGDSIGEGKWDWSKSTGAPYEGDWNYYETTIDNIKYNVYVVTYGTALKANEITPEKAMPCIRSIWTAAPAMRLSIPILRLWARTGTFWLSPRARRLLVSRMLMTL